LRRWNQITGLVARIGRDDETWRGAPLAQGGGGRRDDKMARRLSGIVPNLCIQGTVRGRNRRGYLQGSRLAVLIFRIYDQAGYSPRDRCVATSPVSGAYEGNNRQRRIQNGFLGPAQRSTPPTSAPRVCCRDRLALANLQDFLRRSPAYEALDLGGRVITAPIRVGLSRGLASYHGLGCSLALLVSQA